jgi:ribosome-associated protein
LVPRKPVASAPKRRAGVKSPSPRRSTATGAKKPATRTKKEAGEKPVKKRAAKAAPAPVAPAPEPQADTEALAAARVAAEAALSKKAENVVILDVRGLTTYADYFVIATGTSDRQVSAIADAIDEEMKKAGHDPIGVEGYTKGHWVLLDFGDVVAHVFYEEARMFYDIEGLWADARKIEVA